MDLLNISHRRPWAAVTATTAATVIAVSTASTVLAGPSLAAENCTDTHQSVTSGTFEWGVKDSWRTYLQGNVAKGGWRTSGITDRGGIFGFSPTPESAVLNGSDAVIPFDGSIEFHGHSGALDMTISDITLVISGYNAGIQVDYESNKFAGTASGPGELISGDDVIIATVSLDQAFDAEAGAASLSGTTALSSEGAVLFGNYNAGDAFDRTDGTLTLDEACGKAPAGATTNSDGMSGMLKELSGTFAEVNSLLGHASKLLDHTDDLYGRVWKGETATPAQPATGASAPNASGTSGAAAGTIAASAGTTARPSGTPAAGQGRSDRAATSQSGGAGAALAASGTDVCTAESSRGVTTAQARWGVRESFRNYISGGIAKGGWELTGIGEEGGQFLFQGDSGAVDQQAGTGTILFPGKLRFTGHDGVLDTRLSNLEIQFAGNSGSLVANASSQSTEGDPQDFGRVALATLSFSQLDLSDTSVTGAAQTTLTEAGSLAFGDFYPAGDPLDPISFDASLGGAASCAEGQGGVANAASTVGGSTGGASAAALRSGAPSGGAGAGFPSATTSGSVLDEFATDGATTSENLGGEANDQFRIKSAGASNSADRDRLVTMVLLIVAALVVAGGSMSSFVRKNPTAGGQ